MKQTFSEQADRALAHANTFGLLALTFFDPTRELLQQLMDGTYLAALAGSAGELPALAPLRAVQARLAEEDPAAALRALKVEYARLFIGPGRAAVSPYETIYDSLSKGVQPLLMVSPAALAVEQAYREAGVAVAAGLAEPPDHFAAEAEFMYYLGQKEAECWTAGDRIAAEGWQERANAFLDAHLGGWGREFCRLVEAESRHPFYRAAAHFAAACLALAGDARNGPPSES